MVDTRIEKYLQRAIDLSHRGMEQGIGGPFGCVIVHGDIIVGEGSNQVTSQNDPTAHAEVVAIRQACQTLGSFQLTDCEIFTSCEPCPMCLGAIYWARPKAVYFANSRVDAADAGFDDSFIYDQINLPVAERQIPFIAAPMLAAKLVFERWKQDDEKVTY
jgi:tRNA(Arg) A34 adenosine deaminase TadA